MSRNYFVEGIQGAGKTTMVDSLSKDNPSYKVYREGDYCPVELAWCALVNHKQYAAILKKYEDIAVDIQKNTVSEGDNKVIMYTRIITDIQGFHKDLEQYEIYNGNTTLQEFQDIVLRRFDEWNGQNEIFECALFQNIIENMILFYEMSDEEIISFYRRVKDKMQGKSYEIIYLCVDDIQKAEERIRKERSDDKGNEVWFSLMTAYLENSPYGKHHNLKGMDGLVTHLEHRVDLEMRILKKVFAKQYQVVHRA